jgi:hypothetical protein
LKKEQASEVTGIDEVIQKITALYAEMTWEERLTERSIGLVQGLETSKRKPQERSQFERQLRRFRRIKNVKRVKRNPEDGSGYVGCWSQSTTGFVDPDGFSETEEC